MQFNKVFEEYLELYIEAKEAPKGKHYDSAGRLQSGDADADGRGGPKYRSDPTYVNPNEDGEIEDGEDYSENEISILADIDEAFYGGRTMREVIKQFGAGNVNMYVNYMAERDTDKKKQVNYSSNEVEDGNPDLFNSGYEDDYEEDAEGKIDKDRMKCNSPRRTSGGSKKFVVKACKDGKEKIVRFGDPNMRIKKSNPKRRKSFRARHKCDQKKDKFSAGYWACKSW